MDVSRFRSVILFLALTITFLTTSSEAKPQVYQEPERGELRRVPDTHPRSYLSARDLLAVGDTNQAFFLLSRSLDRYPYHEPSLRKYLQMILRREGIQALRTAVKNHYQRTESSRLYRSFFQDREDSTSDVGDLLRWIDRRQPDPYLRRLRVQRLLDERRFEEAAHLLRDARDRFPEDRWLILLHAEALAAQSRCERAYRTGRMLLSRYPGWPRAYVLPYHLLADHSSERAREIRARYRSLTGSDRMPDSRVPVGACHMKPGELSGQSS